VVNGLTTDQAIIALAANEGQPVVIDVARLARLLTLLQQREAIYTGLALPGALEGKRVEIANINAQIARMKPFQDKGDA
jgi:hypothetical protein